VKPLSSLVPLIPLIVVVVIALAFGIDGAIASTSPRKDKSIFLATLFFGIALCIAPTAGIIDYYRLPRLETNGVIVSASVHSAAKGYRTNVLIAVPGGDVSLYAGGRSNFFHAGELVHVNYQSYSGEILKASFLAKDGHPEGVFQSTGLLGAWLGLLLGCWIMWAARRRYSRLPQGDVLHEAEHSV
jgi:hypothetical protein